MWKWLGRGCAAVASSALFGTGCGPSFSWGASPEFVVSIGRRDPTLSMQAPAETIDELQTCADRYAKGLSADSYGILVDIKATEAGRIASVNVDDSMLDGSDVEVCILGALERMELPTAATNTQHVSSQSRFMVGLVQTAAAPIALAPIALVAAGVTIVLGVTIYVGAEAIEAARKYRPKPTLNRCLDAAAGGTYLWEEFCRSMSEPGSCWSKTYESEQNKRNWCFAKFGK